MEFVYLFIAAVLVIVLLIIVTKPWTFWKIQKEVTSKKKERNEKRREEKEKVKKTIQTIDDLLDETNSFISEIRESKVDTEKKLKESELRFQTIFKNASIGIARFSDAGVCIEANKSFGRLIGIFDESRNMSRNIINNYNRFIQNNKNEHDFVKFLDEIIQSEINVGIEKETYTKNLLIPAIESELSYRLPDGEDKQYYFISVTVVPIRNEDSNKPEFYDVFIEDLTAQKKIEEVLKRNNLSLEKLVDAKTRELAESRDLYKSLYSNANVGLFRCSLYDGKFTEANDYVLKLFGLSESDMFDKSIFDYLTEDGKNERLRKLNENKECGTYMYECNLTIQRIRYTVSISEIINAAGEYFDGVLIDITKLKDLENQLKKMNFELEEKVKERTEKLENTFATIQQAHAELQETHAALQESHDYLNTIISSMPAGLMLVKSNGIIEDVFKSWEYNRYMHLKGKRVHEVLGEKFSKALFDKMTEVEKHKTQVTLTTSKGEYIYQIFVTPVYEKSYLVSVKDVTDQIKLERFLKKICRAISCLMVNPDKDDAVNSCCKAIGECLDVDRVYIFENKTVDNELYCKQIYEWTSKNGVSSQLENEQLQMLKYSDIDTNYLLDDLTSRRPWIITDVENIQDDNSKKILQDQEIKSIILMPIFNNDKFCGYIGLDDCHRNRDWKIDESNVLSTISDCLGVVLFENKGM